MTAMMLALQLTVTLEAGEPGPVSVALPAGVDLTGPWRLIRADDGVEVPVQLDGGAAVFLPGAGRAYRLERSAPKAFAPVECVEVKGAHLTIRAGGKDVLRYNIATVQPPAGVDPLFARSGYIHPIWSPSGKVITNDFPKNHLHHHGLWYPWTETQFEGRKVDFWNSAKKEGRVEHVAVTATVSGPVFAGFTVTHRFVDLKAPGGEKPVLDETWEVRVYDGSLIDLVSTQRCAGDAPLKLLEYRYGGLGFRGSERWEGKEGCTFLTSEAKTRADGHATAARWCAMTGKIEGVAESIGFLCHPSNFRAPQRMRIHPEEPFFNWAPCQAGDFSIEPGKPYVARYRFVVKPGELSAEAMERHYAAYAKPAAATVGGGPDPEAGFVRLDNGKDLEGWKGEQAGWSVADGAIRLKAAEAKGSIYAVKPHGADCVIRLEFRAAEGADSGVYVRGKQLQVRDYPKAGPAEYAAHAKPAGQWNALEFDITGGLAVVRLNGQAIEKGWTIGSKADEGLGLQKERGDFEFRNIRIKEKR